MKLYLKNYIKILSIQIYHKLKKIATVLETYCMTGFKHVFVNTMLKVYGFG